MATLLVDTVTEGMEQIQRVVLYALMQELNPALVRVAAAWSASDMNLAALRDVDYAPTTLQSVLPMNFYDGHRPSLIGASIEKYPNVAVIISRATVAPESSQYDHQSCYRVPCLVELMVKATQEEGEEVCNRRAHRMVEAAHAVILANETLGGLVSGFEAEPTGSTTQLFTRKEQSHHGPEWLWQGGRIECVYRKESSRGSTFRGVPSLEVLGIDQA